MPVHYDYWEITVIMQINSSSGRKQVLPPFNLLHTAIMILIIVSIVSCKKDNADDEEEMPVFGNCESVVPSGGLSQTASGGPYKFVTSGGGEISIDVTDQIKIKHKDYTNFTIELWGVIDVSGKLSANHESLNGKHIKDRENVRRSVIFPDGAKITMLASANAGPLLWISIYDNGQMHHINLECGKLEYSVSGSSIAQDIDDREADGESSTFEITSTGLTWTNIYNEETPGNRTVANVPLGELSLANPSQVRDYYDDTRLGHTRGGRR